MRTKQAGIIIIFCRLLHYPLSKLRQPRVIAEIIGGILLGPSVLGRIPGFTNAIFPAASMPTLSAAANLGLIFFLFLVGLEVDLRLLLSNWRVALGVGAAGMAIPFGLGCAIAYGLYHEFNDDPGLVPVKFGTYLLFVGVAMAITVSFEFHLCCHCMKKEKTQTFRPSLYSAGSSRSSSSYKLKLELSCSLPELVTMLSVGSYWLFALRSLTLALD